MRTKTVILSVAICCPVCCRYVKLPSVAVTRNGLLRCDHCEAVFGYDSQRFYKADGELRATYQETEVRVVEKKETIRG